MLLAVITVLSLTSPLSTHAQTSADQSKIRSKVQALGVNPDKKVEVKLRDTTKVKGFITSVDKDTFSVSNAATGRPENIAYSDVVDIKKSGGGLSTKTWLIGTVIEVPVPVAPASGAVVFATCRTPPSAPDPTLAVSLWK